MEIYLRRSNWGEGIELMVKEGRHFGAPVMMVKSETPGLIQDPTLTLDKTEAQRMMDGLWDCGLRPSEGSGSAGSLKATQNHLEDMRTLVFEAKPPIPWPTEPVLVDEFDTE